MPTNPYVPVRVDVANPPRGDGTQADKVFAAQSFVGTFAWGSNAGTATIVYIGDEVPVTYGALVVITMGAHKFWGTCRSDTSVDSSSGHTHTLEFVDLRDFLTWDYVYCAFNLKDATIVGGVLKKRYRHLMPAGFDTYSWTYTDNPLFAWEIVAAILNFKWFNGGTIGSPWAWDFTGNGEFAPLLNVPVYELDFTNGERLDAALNRISSELGLVYGLGSTAAQPYRLVWTRKGYGNFLFPDKCDDRRVGLAVSGNPTNVRILGDRNLYQCLDVPMTRDWAAAWEKFLDIEQFAHDIFLRGADPLTGVRYNAIPADTEQYQGRLRAAARAREITVREYAALRAAVPVGGDTGTAEDFRDYRKFAGRWRLDMPAALYLQALVFRAFRPETLPADVGPDWEIAPQMLCRVTHDPTTGAMTAHPEESVQGNGYAIVKGYQVGKDLFRSFKPEQIDENFFKAAGQAYVTANFNVDDSGEGQRFIIFDEPVFTSENLLTKVDGHVVINAEFTLQVPAVRAALTFVGAPYTHWQGTYPNVGRDAVLNVGGLSLQVVVKNGVWTEIPYASGKYAFEIAQAKATAFLLRQYAYADGGYKFVWNPETTPMSAFGTGLSSLVDRVVIRTSPSEGVYETVDFTTERARDYFEPERELERKTLLNSLFPGQDRLRQEAEDFRRLAVALKQTPTFVKLLNDIFAGVTATWIPTTTVETLVAGSVVRKKPTVLGTPNRNTTPALPSVVTPTSGHTVFAGLVVGTNWKSTKPFHVATQGEQLARVLGPVVENDVVGLAAAGDYLIKDGTPTVGKVRQQIAPAGVRLVTVMLGGGGAAATGPVVRHRLKEIFANYLRCRTWDGLTEGTTDVFIAKNAKLRNFLNDAPDGISISYSYLTFVKRTATFQAQSEVQVVVPRYIINEEIFACEPQVGTSVTRLVEGQPVEVTWLDLNVDGRAWAREFA